MRIYLLGWICLLVSSCSLFQTTDFVWNEVEGLFKIQLPSNMRTAKLNADASLQKQNFQRDFCIVVREDSWTFLQNKQPDFKLEDFFDVSIEKILAGMDGGKGEVPQTDSLVLNGAPCFQAKIEGNFQGDPVVFQLAVVQGKTHLFQVLSWGLATRYEEQKPFMDQMIGSFTLDQVPADSLFWLNQ